MKPILALLLALALLAPLGPATAQESTDGSPRLREIFDAMVLPRISQEAREAGVPEADVRIILEETARRQLPPRETVELLEETTVAVRESGPVDNFGAFVQARLDEGLRGRELAAAIHEEHRLRGKGKGHGRPDHAGQGQGKAPDKGQGKGPDKAKGNKGGNGQGGQR